MTLSQLEREVREGVGHDAGELSPFHGSTVGRQRRRLVERLSGGEVGPPGGGRHLAHAAEEPALGTRTQENICVIAHHHEGGAAT